MLNNLLDFFAKRKRQSKWQRGTRNGRSGLVIKPGFYNKPSFRLNRSSLKHVEPAKPSGKNFASSDGKSRYQIYTDGSLRKLVQMKRR
jgi:hypothetical protein